MAFRDAIRFFSKCHQPTATFRSHFVIKFLSSRNFFQNPPSSIHHKNWKFAYLRTKSYFWCSLVVFLPLCIGWQSAREPSPLTTMDLQILAAVWNYFKQKRHYKTFLTMFHLYTGIIFNVVMLIVDAAISWKDAIFICQIINLRVNLEDVVHHCTYNFHVQPNSSMLQMNFCTTTNVSYNYHLRNSPSLVDCSPMRGGEKPTREGPSAKV